MIKPPIMKMTSSLGGQARWLRMVVATSGLAILWSTEAVAQPATYDLRSVVADNSTLAWVPAIQNQGAASDCWTFASATALDSSLLMQGILPTLSIPPAIQTSSWHLSTHNGAPDQLEADEALGNNSNWGGDMYQSLGYLTRGRGSWQIPNAPADATKFIQLMSGGPVFDSAPVSPSNAFPAVISEDNNGWSSNLGQYIPPTNQPLAYRVTSLQMLDQGFGGNTALPTPSGTKDIGGTTYSTFSFSQGAADPQVAAVKEAVLAKGAVTTYMNADYSAFGFVPNAPGASRPYTVTYVNPEQAIGYSNHVVTIIGWDDNYQISRNGTVVATGAWKVQNSWGHNYWTGTDNENDGTFYAPYDDAVIGRSGVVSFVGSPKGMVADGVLQNELGPMEYAFNFAAGSGTSPLQLAHPMGMVSVDSHLAASVLTPGADGQLIGLGIATMLGDVVVEVGIYESWLNGPQGLILNDSFELDRMGYAEFALESAVNLSALDDIIVTLTYLDADTLSTVTQALPVTIGGSGLNGYLTVDAGLSYYESGGTWTDFSSMVINSEFGDNAQGGVLFLKGLVAIPEPSVLLLTALAALGALADRIHQRKNV